MPPRTPSPWPFVVIAVATSVIGFILDKVFDRHRD